MAGSSVGADKPFNPFENPLPSMLIAPLPPPSPASVPPLPPSVRPSAGHNLMLNKFAVVENHFILTTADVRPQTHLLEPADLAAAHACIATFRDHGEELFVFFNSGPHSGASQPHRHLQLMPIESMREGLQEQDRERWDVLANGLLRSHESESGKHLRLPFRVFIEPIHHGMTSHELHDLYRKLYRRARDAVKEHQTAVRRRRQLPSTLPAPSPQLEKETDDESWITEEISPEGDEVDTLGAARISYNMALTSSVLAVLPRLAEGAPIPTSREPSRTVTAGPGDMKEQPQQLSGSVSVVSFNGTVLAGTALVKGEEEWEALRNDPGLLEELLRRIAPGPADGSNEGDRS